MSKAAERKPLYPLIPSQLAAVDPGDNIWLSASAGTGKTQVLTARVVRLLLEEDVEPENLLCITFTKAGAAEMAERISQLLGSWVQLEDKLLFRDLEAIGARSGPEYRQRASELFAKVLDAPSGGLQIMTIHSFCQSLLGSFPEEAGLVPGFKPVEGAEQQALLREALASMVISAEDTGDIDLITKLQKLSLDLGEEATVNFLGKCAAVPDVMDEIPEGTGAEIWARRLAGVTFEGSPDEMLERELADSKINRADIQSIAEQNMTWAKGKSDSRGGKRARIIYNWLGLEPAQRAAEFMSLHRCWSNAQNEALVCSSGHTPLDDTYSTMALDLYNWTRSIFDQLNRAVYTECLAKALLVGKRLAHFYGRAKHVRGVIDFDDMIRRTAALLNDSDMAQWVRFKLDRNIDHILVDEAQDTNTSQWDIVSAIASDFFSGLGQRPEKSRTIFSVGDFKQAIYGFQGTAPERYEEAGEKFSAEIAGAGGELSRLTLSQSFRSTAPVLDFVNALIDSVGSENFGVVGEVPDHYSHMSSHVGQVELLAPVSPKNEDETGGDEEESWVPNQKRELAEKLADYAKELIDERPWLATQNRHLEPRDIMFLLSRRGDIASLLVAQLHERGVPVAGVDRLRLAQPLVVQDLLAAIRFVLQPEDDLSLACILVSPIIGWTQEQLLEHGYRGEKRVSLWQHLREKAPVAGELEPLRTMLDAADYVTVYDFLEDILSGPIAARRKFVARLGTEALVPIEEMLNMALLFQQQQGGGLQSFLHWFENGENIIKREGEGGANEVRVMTVHGSKGLQAPVVILADATSDPKKKADRTSELLIDEGKRVPLLPIRGPEKSGSLLEIVELQQSRELQEHCRLLYVAITRAEERLIMGGALNGQSKGVPPADSWYTKIENSMRLIGCDWIDDTRWGQVMRYVGIDGLTTQPREISHDNKGLAESSTEPPAWMFEKAPQESRPPRPLVPSRLEDDDYGEAPPSLAMQAAATRGKILHALFERVTDEASLDAAAKWLETAVHDDAVDKGQLLQAVTNVVQNPEWADFFKPNAQAEVPLAALVGETVITGRLDRLVVEPGRVRVIDFKTGRSVPENENDVIKPYLRQMAHYVAALEAIFPGSVVEASLLYTHGPRLIRLPDIVLAPHKPDSVG